MKQLENTNEYYVANYTPEDFNGNQAHERGNEAGNKDPFSLFKVTGEVKLAMFGVCEEDLVSSSGTISAGITDDTDLLIASTTASNIDNKELWYSNTPANGLAFANLAFYIISNTTIVEAYGTASITSGKLRYVCLWQPLTPGSEVVPVS